MGATSRYAVVGHPVAHSLSPFIHDEFARQTGEAVAYERLLCPLDAFADSVRSFAAGGASGCNVTMPFKFEAFTLAARHTPRAELAGACNTLRFDAGGWTGDNADGAGLVADIVSNAGVSLRGARLLLVGAGGGAAGALGPLLAAGPAEVVVANRTASRAAELVARHALAAAAAGAVLRASALEDCGHAFDVVVNASASSVTSAALPVDAAVLRPGTLALDMMYGPPAEGFVAWARAHGATGRDGLGMLVEQAAEAFFFWRGVRPRTDVVLAMLREQVDKR
ncbi:MAG: shikimate dehydrogenase [Burkholderiales bacterium]|nr:shikimate dehydrogenase [Burkholderiales bacterium]